MSRLLGFYGTQMRVLWEWRGGPVALFKRLADHARRGDRLVPGDRLDPAADARRRLRRRGVRRHPDVAVQRHHPSGRPGPRGARLAHPRRRSWSSSSRSSHSSSSPSGRRASMSTASGPPSSASFIYAIINTILTSILGIDSGGSYYGLLVQRLLVRRSQGHTDKPGLVIIQIDGLAHPILAGRMRAGSVNTMAGMVRDGSHKLSRWEAILPSMTSGSQAGILHGNNDGIPAFRWYERDREHLMASSNPVDADPDRVPHLERRGPALEQRREHLQPDDWRRDAVLPDDGGDQGRGWRDRRQQRLPVVLLQPDRLPALVHAVPRRVPQGADPGAADAPVRDPAADAPRAEVRGHAGRQQRPASRRQYRR